MQWPFAARFVDLRYTNQYLYRGVLAGGGYSLPPQPLSPNTLNSSAPPLFSTLTLQWLTSTTAQTPTPPPLLV